jgi:hypothetical protein
MRGGNINNVHPNAAGTALVTDSFRGLRDSSRILNYVFHSDDIANPLQSTANSEMLPLAVVPWGERIAVVFPPKATTVFRCSNDSSPNRSDWRCRHDRRGGGRCAAG